jgi:hypothetical protein
MPRIIRQDFSPADFNKILDEFLFQGAGIAVPAESITSFREYLVKWGVSLQKVFEAYFEREDNARYDNLTDRMKGFIQDISKYNVDLKGEERKAFLLFWNEIAEIIKADYLQLQVQYLANSCNYFIFEINKLS